MNTDELAAIRERCDTATPGPWQIGRLLIDGQKHRSVHDAEGWMVANLDLRNRTAEDAEANVFFIAHARTDIPALLAEVERLREGLEGWKQIAAEWKAEAVRLQNAEANV